MINTPFALKGDVLIHISEASSGLSDHVCPSYGDVLLSRSCSLEVIGKGSTIPKTFLDQKVYFKTLDNITN